MRITTEPSFSIEPAEVLARGLGNTGLPQRHQFDVMPDGSGFLGFGSAANDASAAPNQINIVYNWFDELNRLVPAK